MEKQVYKIDENGYFLENVIVEIEKEVSFQYTEIHPMSGLYKPKWTGTEWTEGLTQEEIDEINNVQTELTTEERVSIAEKAINDMIMLMMM